MAFFSKGTAGPSRGAISESIGPILPQEQCAICLEKCESKCYADHCKHAFCFRCLRKWSKIKPECPLCRRPFQVIIHNVRTMWDYDCYHVQRFPYIPELPAVDNGSGNNGRNRGGNRGGNPPAGGNGDGNNHQQQLMWRRQQQHRIRRLHQRLSQLRAMHRHRKLTRLLLLQRQRDGQQ